MTHTVVISDTEVIVQKAWIEGLIDYAQRAKNTQAATLNMDIHALLGYIESAKQILK